MEVGKGGCASTVFATFLPSGSGSCVRGEARRAGVAYAYQHASRQRFAHARSSSRPPRLPPSTSAPAEKADLLSPLRPRVSLISHLVAPSPSTSSLGTGATQALERRYKTSVDDDASLRE